MEMTMEISDRYDALPYPAKFFAQTNPTRMAALATLFGVEAPDPKKSRILEFGCGDGSNLISHAFTLPESEFVGIDISGKHIKTANDWVEETGLKNIEFRKCDLMEIDESDFGEFDYLVAHGLIAWIPDAVAQRVFELFGSLIAENGVGYVSYNTYPGGYLREMVRDMMMFHTRDINGPLQKVETATSFLALFAENMTEQTPYSQVLMAENRRHKEHSASDIYHDDLSDDYTPFRFSEIAARLGTNGLQYLCESELQSMSVRTLSPEIQGFLNNIPDRIEREDYIDFARGRQFRKTLFCRNGQAISPEIDPSRLSDLALASTARPEKMDDVGKPSKAVRFVSQLGTGIEIDHLVTKMVLTKLGLRGAAPLQFQDLLDEVKRELDGPEWETDEAICRRILIRIIEDTAMIELYSKCEPRSGNLPEKPRASRLTRWQLKVGASVTSSYGAVIGLNDSVAKRLIELSDGTRDIAEIEREIRMFVKNEGIEEEVRSDLGAWVEESLMSLLRSGVIDSVEGNS